MKRHPRSCARFQTLQYFPDTYFQVVISQTVALQNERNEIDIRRRQMAARVLLIAALGKGWDTSQLPTC
jgi:outer membrane protein TolC